MPSTSNHFALTNTASKGPPPLPAIATSPLPPREVSAEEIFFQEGIDGRAESVPSCEPDVIELDGSHLVSSAEVDSPSWRADNQLAAEEEVEDPARTRRRRAARIGVAWGAVAALVLTAAAAFLTPRRDVRLAASSASAPRIETTALTDVAPPSPAPEPLSAAAAPPRPVRVTTASVTTSHPASPRGTLHAGARPSPAKRPASRPPRAHDAHAKRTVKHSAARVGSPSTRSHP